MIISGKDLALRIKHDIAEKVKECEKKYGRVPHQVVILVGEDPASMSYVKSKGKDAEQVGFKVPPSGCPSLLPRRNCSTSSPALTPTRVWTAYWSSSRCRNISTSPK